jgi:hypothetical protein
MANQNVKFDSLKDINLYDKDETLICHEDDKFIYEEFITTCDLCKDEVSCNELLICNNCNKNICLSCSHKNVCSNAEVPRLKFKFRSYFR